MKQVFKHLLVLQQHNADDSIVLARAIKLAQQHQSRITIFKSFYQQLHNKQPYSDRADDDLALFVREQQQIICRQISAITEEQINLDIIISWREAERPAIARLVGHTDVTMIIKRQQKPRGLLSLPGLGLEHYLISDCPLPVWLVKPDIIDYELNILACLDVDSELPGNQVINNTILDIGCELSGETTEQLQIVNCYCSENYSMSLPYNEHTGFEPLPNIAQQHNDKLQSYLNQHKLPLQCLHLSEGLPDDEIPRMADKLHSRLAIIGNNHMHNLVSAFLGDTAHYLTEHTPCDVLVVKPDLSMPLPH